MALNQDIKYAFLNIDILKYRLSYSPNSNDDVLYIRNIDYNRTLLFDIGMFPCDSNLIKSCDVSYAVFKCSTYKSELHNLKYAITLRNDNIYEVEYKGHCYYTINASLFDENLNALYVLTIDKYDAYHRILLIDKSITKEHPLYSFIYNTVLKSVPENIDIVFTHIPRLLYRGNEEGRSGRLNSEDFDDNVNHFIQENSNNICSLINSML